MEFVYFDFWEAFMIFSLSPFDSVWWYKWIFPDFASSLCYYFFSWCSVMWWRSCRAVEYIKGEASKKAFIQIGRMENYFRNLTAKVGAKLDFQSRAITAVLYDFSKFQLIFYVPPSQVTLDNRTTVWWSYIVHKFHKMLLFMKIYLPSKNM